MEYLYDIVGSVFGPIRFLLPVCRFCWFLYIFNIHLYMHIFHHIFLSNYWWQESDIWIWWIQKRFQRYGVPIWSLWPNIRSLPSIVAEKNVMKNVHISRGIISELMHLVSLWFEILTWFLVWECIIIIYRSTLKFVLVEWFLANIYPLGFKIWRPVRNVNLICDLSLYTHIPNIKSISQSIVEKKWWQLFYFGIMEWRTWVTLYVPAGTYKIILVHNQWLLAELCPLDFEILPNI
jgi:hypothetical protein